MIPISGKSVEPAHYTLYGVLYLHGESEAVSLYGRRAPPERRQRWWGSLAAH
jgi:hypothetical protein